MRRINAPPLSFRARILLGAIRPGPDLVELIAKQHISRDHPAQTLLTIDHRPLASINFLRVRSI
jgi:hypothetical protein